MASTASASSAADVAQAFRNDLHLQRFFLADVTPTGNVLGIGSYGSVEEVSIARERELLCLSQINNLRKHIF